MNLPLTDDEFGALFRLVTTSEEPALAGIYAKLQAMLGEAAKTQRTDGKLVWTKHRPNQPGYFWCRNEPDPKFPEAQLFCCIACVCLIEHLGTPLLSVSFLADPVTITSIQLAELKSPLYFAGPIAPPPYNLTK